jgi:hypothetical protein
MEELLNLLAELVYGNETIMEVNYVNSNRRNHSSNSITHLRNMVRRDADADESTESRGRKETP